MNFHAKTINSLSIFFPGQFEVCQILINAAAQVNITDDNGLTAFCIAKANGIYRIYYSN